MSEEADVAFVLIVRAPVKGVAYSLQGKNNAPVNSVVAGAKDLTFRFSARLATGKAGPRFLGEFVRAEGKSRRFVYIATGEQAGQAGTHWSRRAKIDLPDPTADLMAHASASGLVLQAEMAGADAKGEPTCATVRLLEPWTPKTR